MAEIKKPVFNPDAAEEYFSMLLTSYRDTANDIFRRDNEGRHASEQHYSAEYQKYVGMQIAMREVLEYFGKFDLGDWISVKDRLPEHGARVLVCDIYASNRYVGVWNFEKDPDDGSDCWEDVGGWWQPLDAATHWRPLPELPEEEEHGNE